jgi:hypothetical protein
VDYVENLKLIPSLFSRLSAISHQQRVHRCEQHGDVRLWPTASIPELIKKAAIEG